MGNLIIILGVCSILFVAYTYFNFMQKKAMLLTNSKLDNVLAYMLSQTTSIELSLAGVEEDGNSDYKVMQAIGKINMPEDIEVNPND